MTDPIIVAKKHFDCNENTSDEEKWVRAQYNNKQEQQEGGMSKKPEQKQQVNVRRKDEPEKIKREPEKSKTVEPEKLKLVTQKKQTNEPAPNNDEEDDPLCGLIDYGAPPPIPATAPVVVNDPFTCFVQDIVVRTLYGENLPKDGPDKEKDGNLLYNDKIFFHRAAVSAHKFTSEYLIPHTKKLAQWLKEKLNDDSCIMSQFLNQMLICTEMIVEEDVDGIGKINVWTNLPFTKGERVRIVTLFQEKYPISICVTEDVAEFLKAVHNVYHLDNYVHVTVIEKQSENVKGQPSCVHTWAALVSDELAHLPVSEWHDLTGLDFVDYILSLYAVWLQSYGLFQPIKKK